MDDLNALWIFRAVAEHGSCAAAARKLGLSNNSVNGTIKRLEASLKVTLLLRTTRSAKLTEAGKLYLAHYGEVSVALKAARSLVMGKLIKPTVTPLRVRAPSLLLNRCIAPLLPRFLSKDTPPMVLLTGEPPSSSTSSARSLSELVLYVAQTPPDKTAHALASIPRIVVTSTSYLGVAPLPKEPEELEKLNCLSLTQEPKWRLKGPRGTLELPVSGTISADTEEALLPALLSGAGVALLPLYLVERELSQGTLMRSLPGYSDDWTLYASYPKEANALHNAKRFLEFLSKELTSL
jgi:molybdate transport repressor ModE-like protein